LGVIQEQTYNPIIQKHYEIAFKSEGIDIDQPVVKWEPLGEEKALEKAQTKDTEATRLGKLQDTGAIDAEDIRDTLMKDRNSLLELAPKDVLADMEENEDIDTEGTQGQNSDKENDEEKDD
ncbi:hypothetical protein KAR91_59415, partial [Candidatus Pacearchaeota archaeon]|nr:hypothetical protein [Candidatus Pacearchaeota archaeon]